LKNERVRFLKRLRSFFDLWAVFSHRKGGANGKKALSLRSGCAFDFEAGAPRNAYIYNKV